MSVSYPAGSRVLVRKARSGIRRGAVVIVPHPDPETGWQLTAPPPTEGEPSWFLKRVTAVAGDPLPGDPDVVLAAGTLYLLGENDQSWDSRALGPCPVAAVCGVVVTTLSRSAPSNR
jgi:signal peptidase I